MQGVIANQKGVILRLNEGLNYNTRSKASVIRINVTTFNDTK